MRQSRYDLLTLEWKKMEDVYNSHVALMDKVKEEI